MTDIKYEVIHTYTNILNKCAKNIKAAKTKGDEALEDAWNAKMFATVALLEKDLDDWKDASGPKTPDGKNIDACKFEKEIDAWQKDALQEGSIDYSWTRKESESGNLIVSFSRKMDDNTYDDISVNVEKIYEKELHIENNYRLSKEVEKNIDWVFSLQRARLEALYEIERDYDAMLEDDYFEVTLMDDGADLW